MSDQAWPPVARPGVAAGALFSDDGGRVMVVRPTYKPELDIPGGLVEPAETPYEACVREVGEELGIRPPVGRLLVVDWAPYPGRGDMVLFVFDGGILDAGTLGRITFPDAELSAYEFRAVEELDGLLTERLARRIKAAAEARDSGRTLYLEHGLPLAVPRDGHR